jgi:protoporphyrinogen oxidase
MSHVRTLILGGGLSGLSTAYHLKSPYRLLEKSNEPGGLSRSINHEGFTFDYTGHLLHLRHPYTLRLIPELLGDNLVLNRRRSWIYSHNTFTRYPFQANLFGLPPRVIKDCLLGLLDAHLSETTATPSPEPFGHWVQRTFGRGFAKHFFFPYNEKLWTIPTETLTTEWLGEFVPKPSLAEVLAGAFSKQIKKYGYNTTFYYPKRGGIQVLASAFAKHLTNLSLSTEVSHIDLAQKQVTTAEGETIGYDHLVSTLPLVHFLAIARPLPPDVLEASQRLRWSAIYNLNLGVRRPRLTDKHWIYFPEKEFRFYRVGFPMNFSPHMTPRGCSSMYIEIAYAPGHPPDDQEALAESLRGLYACGLLERNDAIIAQKVLHIPIAYVTFDRHRTLATSKILSYLQSQNVHSIGRFGAWKYSYMEEAILDGKATAEILDGYT